MPQASRPTPFRHPNDPSFVPPPAPVALGYMRGNAAEQTRQLHDVIRRAVEALPAAGAGMLFSSEAGHRLVNAMHDLTQADGLYDLANDVAHDAGVEL